MKALPILILALSLLAGCNCNDSQCGCQGSSTLPVNYRGSLPDTFYWVRTSLSGNVIDSVQVHLPDRTQATVNNSAADWLLSLSSYFPHVTNPENFSYILVNTTLQSADTFTNFDFRHVTDQFTCCGEEINCHRIDYSTFVLNYVEWRAGDPYFEFTPD